MNTIDLIAEKIRLLSASKKEQILGFVGFSMLKSPQKNQKKYAEQLATERLKDLDDPDNPNLWHTVVEVDEEVDVESSLKNLRKSGYKIKIPNKS